MPGCYVEQRTVAANSTISWDIAHHLFTRQLRGIAIVVTAGPNGLLSAVTKQWYKIVRQAERERASTLNAARIVELTHEIAVMHRFRFGTETPGAPYGCDVFFVQGERLATIPPACHTLYIADMPDNHVLTRILHHMPQQSLVVTYVRAKK